MRVRKQQNLNSDCRTHQFKIIMTLCVCVTTSEGIVIAADSRQTYINKAKMPRVGSDYGQKVFQLNYRVGAATCGWAFLKGKNISGWVNDFRTKNKDTLFDMSVSEIAQKLVEFFETIYNEHIAAKLDPTVQEGQRALSFYVAGYDKNASLGQVYDCAIPGGHVTKLPLDTNNPNANWNGQSEMVTRLILGADPEIKKLKGFTKELETELVKLELATNFQMMTIQDAIDYAIFLIRTTVDAQRFSDGIALHPGDIPGVGGAIDVAVLRPQTGFEWVQLKKIRGEKTTRQEPETDIQTEQSA